nr:immunoglobulin heavy chain junction region [Macaca mulatta]MOW79287.1 immunoglobulin heavy chain junction region [Macaca mulatta]MOW84813.1 immunoglobulin heavy chain junction region [Macaca mulatta]
CARYHSGFDYW